MPTVSVDKEDFYKALGQVYTTEEFDELCFEFGIELDEDTSTSEPVIVNGVPERPQLKIEIGANRYDMLCLEGIAQALNIFRGKSTIPNYHYSNPKPSYKLTVSPETAKIRPFISCAILRNIKFTPRRYESFIALQDKLHSNICRNRTLAAIGTHNLDSIKGPFTYEALPPNEINFIPLNKDKNLNGADLVSFYANDKHLNRFLHIIEGSPVYPVVLDAKRRVCSLPPIINSEHSKITLDTKNVFVEVTATDKTKCEIVINQIVALFSEYCEEPFTIEPVEIISSHNAQSRLVPNIATRKMEVSINYLNSVCGLKLSPEEQCKLLNKMSITAHPRADRTAEFIDVTIPCTRSDILHQCDVVEDLAIAYGYNNLQKTFPNKSSTIAAPLLINKVGDIFRTEAAYAGWAEVMPLTLCSHDENFAYLNHKDDGNTAVQLANPKTLEYQVVHTSLLPGLLKTVRENLNHALPIHVFDTADVVFKDLSLEAKARNERHFGAVYVGKTSGFEVVHGLLGRLLAMSRFPLINPTDKVKHSKGYFIKEHQDPTFFPGRCATIWLQKSIDAKPIQIGIFGVLHPTVLEKFDIPFAGSSLELNLEPFQ